MGSVRLEIAYPLARIVLSRPEVGNALNLELLGDLLAAAKDCAADDRIRAVLMTAEGRAFCVGGDLTAFDAAGDDKPKLLSAMADRLHATEKLLMEMRAPCVIAVQGAAAGAGFSLSMIGDMVIAGRSAHFTVAYSAIGLSADGGSTHVLPRLIGLRRTQELMLTNRRLSAEEALHWGLVTTVVEDADLAAHAEAVASRLAHGPTGAYAAIKKLLGQTFATDFVRQTADEGREIARLSGGSDAAEGIAAFRAKRPPGFTGAD